MYDKHNTWLSLCSSCTTLCITQKLDRVWYKEGREERHWLHTCTSLIAYTIFEIVRTQANTQRLLPTKFYWSLKCTIIPVPFCFVLYYWDEKHHSLMRLLYQLHWPTRSVVHINYAAQVYFQIYTKHDFFWSVIEHLIWVWSEVLDPWSLFPVVGGGAGGGKARVGGGTCLVCHCRGGAGWHPGRGGLHGRPFWNY